ncbi:MAG: TetR/AcrR family transcriptional regulator [Paeniglutamicibacter terrestris]
MEHSSEKEQQDGRPGKSDGRRLYQSALRDQRAVDTRRRIVDAARGLFSDRGFAGTTIAVIAKHAGVATPTVYAVFSSKAEIVRELIDCLETEADGDKWRDRITDEPEPERKLEIYAAWHRVFFSTGKDVLRAATYAGDDPAVLDLRAQGDSNALAWLAPIIKALSEAKLLAPGLDSQHALDRALLLSSVELYFRATTGRNWTDNEYQQWLTESLRQQLLHP